MSKIQLHRLDLNLLVTFESLMDSLSVTRTANKLGKTPSAVSHALGRLREQLGDPLMVNVGGKMRPSPFALNLIEDVRPILRSIQRAVQPPQPFEPATSRRMFRIAIPTVTEWITEVHVRVQAVAPDVGLEWITPNSQSYTKVADGQTDIALHVADTPLPDGVSEHVLAPMRRYTFARKDHPAIANWNKAAWLKWLHIMVAMSSTSRQTVEKRVAHFSNERRIGASIPDFSGVAPLLARTNLLANQIPVTLSDGLERYDLRVLEPPVDLSEISFRIVWSTRLANEPGIRWLRELVIDSFEDIQTRNDAQVAAAGVIPART